MKTSFTPQVIISENHKKYKRNHLVLTIVALFQILFFWQTIWQTFASTVGRKMQMTVKRQSWRGYYILCIECGQIFHAVLKCFCTTDILRYLWTSMLRQSNVFLRKFIYHYEIFYLQFIFPWFWMFHLLNYFNVFVDVLNITHFPI